MVLILQLTQHVILVESSSLLQHSIFQALSVLDDSLTNEEVQLRYLNDQLLGKSCSVAYRTCSLCSVYSLIFFPFCFARQDFIAYIITFQTCFGNLSYSAYRKDRNLYGDGVMLLQLIQVSILAFQIRFPGPAKVL